MAIAWIVLTLFVCVQLTSGAIVNVALNKPVNVSSRFGGRDPNLGVDGDTDAVDPNVITTDVQQPFAWWTVDLELQVQDPEVKIYFRTDYKVRRNGVRLYTSPTPFASYPGGTLCDTVQGNANGNNINDIYSVSCGGTWRYLMVYTDTDNQGFNGQGPILDFGEVEVLGCDGTYGQLCDKNCDDRRCFSPTATCDRNTGLCPGGCRDGWDGQDCTVCANGRYGTSCEKFCNSRNCAVSSSPCDKSSGACQGGLCLAGWEGTDCTEECLPGSYGGNCLKQCISRQCKVTSATCDRETGECPDGCKPGYRETDCVTECQMGVTYGPECSLSCTARHCLSQFSSCDHVTGRCDGGCAPGWNGTDCIQECPVGTYGAMCDKLCIGRNCVTPSAVCNRETGDCPGGCGPGWDGIDCLNACQSGLTYGANCEKACSSRRCVTSSPCDRFTGNCSGGCQDGWRGLDCTSQCPPRTFGLTCSDCNIRNCQGNTDCPADGTCSGGCQDGWTLRTCTEECPRGTYGQACNFTCGNCSGDDICNHATGKCPGSCSAGFQGEQCQEGCNIKTYGVDCKETCPNCNGTCNPITGHCLKGCLKGYNGTRCEMLISPGPGPDGPSFVPAVAGVVAGLVVIVIIIIVVIIYRRRRSSTSKEYKETDNELVAEHNGLTTNKAGKNEVDNMYVNVELMQGNAKTKAQMREKPKLNIPTKKRQSDPEPEEEVIDEEEAPSNRQYYNDSEDAIREVSVEDLAATIQKIKQRDGGFEEEYNRLPTGFTAPYHDSQKPENAGKNKFRGYYPYDHNRVRLSLLPDVPGSDYINASLMHSYDQKKTYIASQAPNKKTVGDFWRMIWEKRCNQIIMLTGLVEATKVKCYQYWPDDGAFDTDNFQVEVEVTDTRANYTIRHLKATSKKNGDRRSIVQYHFTSWPDHGVPDTLALVHYMWMIRRADPQREGPLLVHCSAGIGRTGTFIAVDSLLDRAQREGVVDVQGYVSVMRGQRKNMIQTKEQYECVFQCLLEMTKFGDTSMSEDNFTSSYNSRGMDSVVGGKTLRELTQMAASETRHDSPNRHRVWVDGNSDFIVKVGPTLRDLRGYLLAVSPPPGLEKLLWKLVDENEVENAVVISKLQGDLVGAEGTSKQYGDIKVTNTGCSNLSSTLTMATLQLKVTNVESSQSVKMLTFADSLTMDSMTSCILDQGHLQRLSAEITHVVIVHRESDRKWAVLFCIMCNILSGIREDHRVDVIGHVRTFLKCCPDLTLSEQEVVKLHDFALKCVETTGAGNVYANL